MSRSTRTVPVRGACLTLCIAGAVVSGVSCRDANIGGPTDPGAANTGPVLAATATTPLPFLQLSAGSLHTCGVTPDFRAYCWGLNNGGQLGDGTATTRLTPVAVLGGLHFREVSAIGGNTCGVTTDNRAYCWGLNAYGQLGDGTTTTRRKPVRVAGALTFRQVAAGYHSCGVTTENRAYCWGLNTAGELGDGTTATRLKPVRVAGALTFRRLSTGGGFTCGVTTANAAFCWGFNRQGQLGDGTEVYRRLRPSRVAGGHRFRQVDAGGAHTCGVTTDFRAYCWGSGRYGELGNGKSYLSFWPRAVSGGLAFERVTAGGGHSCGETTTNRAYCWGVNDHGQLGDGTNRNGVFTYSLIPVSVAGGLFFTQVSAGSAYTCGRTAVAVAYCWGDNLDGQLGDGTWGFDHPTPTVVLGPM